MKPLNDRLISHSVSSDAIEETIKKVSEKIHKQRDQPGATVAEKLNFLNQLANFDFGRFVLQHQGVNAYWTHYMLTHPWFGKKTGKNNRGESFSWMEDFLLNRAPLLLATQERFEIFLKENQKVVADNAKLACIPSGMMGELLYLNFDNIKQIELIGVDYDPQALIDAKTLAEDQSLSHHISLLQRDAWNLSVENQYDLISSNGLNIYEPDPVKVKELYRQFYLALKPGGKLVTSFLTFPPMLTDHCEWDMSVINMQDLATQKTVFVDIIGVKWQQCYQSSEQAMEQFESLNFKDIKFIYDKAKMFPTVIAYKG